MANSYDPKYSDYVRMRGNLGGVGLPKLDAAHSTSYNQIKVTMTLNIEQTDWLNFASLTLLVTAPPSR